MPSPVDDGTDSTASSGGTRRAVLRSVGGIIGLPLGAGSVSYAADRTFTDEDADGVPDHTERSRSVQDRLEVIYGADQFEGFDPDRRDLLIDARYVEGTSIHPDSKRRIVERFRENGIYAQWLDYPDDYDRNDFDDRYGPNVKTLLWDRDSFYRNEVEPVVRDVAVQLVVVPGQRRDAHDGLVYSPWAKMLGSGVDGHVNGFSVGNRAVVGNRSDRWDEERVVFHEIAHLALCHDDDPDNNGVMGTNEKIALTDAEWDTFKRELDTVRDTTGYDIALRRCLWEGCLRGAVDQVR